MQNGATTFDSLADNFKHIAEYFASQAEAAPAPSSVPEPKKSFFARAGKLIKDHPIAAVGIAFGIGYLAVRMIRR